eukprot:7607606-Lingulodinium_polyedra.AAC.1
MQSYVTGCVGVACFAAILRAVDQSAMECLAIGARSGGWRQPAAWYVRMHQYAQQHEQQQP